MDRLDLMNRGGDDAVASVGKIFVSQNRMKMEASLVFSSLKNVEIKFGGGLEGGHPPCPRLHFNHHQPQQQQQQQLQRRRVERLQLKMLRGNSLQLG